MGIRDYLSGIGDKFRSYFYREKNTSEENSLRREKSESDPVGYLERENLFDKFIKYTGTALKYLGFATVAATGIGAVAIATQYIRGKWPFYDVRENEFAITRNAITEKPSRPLRQVVNTLVTPFVKIVRDENKRPVTVSGAVQTASVKDFDIVTRDGKGLINLQYNYQIISPEGAGRFYWDYDESIQSIDNIIETALLAELRNVGAREVPTGFTTIEKEGSVQTKNFLEHAEVRANNSLKEQKTGIEITKFAITEPRFDKALEKAWAAPETERQNVIAEGYRAEQTLIQADAEAKVTQRQAQATLDATLKYLEAGRIYANEGSDRKPGDIALFLADLDNNQEVAARKGRIIKVCPGVPMPSFNFVQYKQNP